MEYAVQEVLPELNSRTAIGRVVVNPPKVMGPLKTRTTTKIFMCCNRAFLTEISYLRHKEEKIEHGKPLDLSKLPKPPPPPVVPRKFYPDSSCREFWIVRKKGIVNKVFYSEDDPEAPEGDHVEKIAVTDVDNSQSGRGKWVKCSICQLSTMSCNMRRHLEICHSNGQCKCDYCPCTFILDSSRKAHQNKMHNIRTLPSTALKQSIARAKKQLISSKTASSLFESISGRPKKEKLCPICGKNFYNLRRLRDHMNSHSGARPYKCDICGFRFTHHSNMYRHKKTSHMSGSKIVCSICKCGFSSDHALSRHNRAMHPQKLKIKKLRSPEKDVPVLAMPRRPVGVIDGVNLPSLTPQHPSQNSSGLYECHVCQKELRTPQSWRGHMLIHQNLKPYKCKLCGIYFRLHGTMMQHRKNAHTDGNYPCKHCSCRFNASNAKERHTSLYHSDKNLKVVSSNTSQPIASNLKQKYPSQNSSGLYECNVCQKELSSTQTLRGHMLIHQNLKPYKCKLCGIHFRLHGTMIQHRKSSHTKGNYPCKNCSCRFNARRALDIHTYRYHANENLKVESSKKTPKLLDGFPDYKCNLCGLATNDAEKFKSHQLLHSEVNRKQCNLCLKIVASTVNLTNHRKRAHGNGPHTCPVCCCRYIASQSLFTHLSREHAMNREDWNFRTKCIHPEALERIQQESRVDFFNNTGPIHSRGQRNGSDRSHSNTTSGKESESSDISTNKIQLGESEVMLTERKAECDLCHMKFSHPGSIGVHKKKAHYHNGAFKCSGCSCKFTTSSGLATHRATYHGYVGRTKTQKLVLGKKLSRVGTKKVAFLSKTRTSRKFKCPKCSKVVIGERSFRNHMNSHKTSKEFECDICHMKFLHRSSISNHKRNSHFHGGEFQCSKCICKFTTSPGLTNHLKVHHGHTGIRPRKKSCDDSFSNHEITTSPVEENVSETETHGFQCVHCDKILSSKNSLEKHILTHTRAIGEKNYECNFCHLRFLHPDSLPKHKKRCHLHNGKIKCPSCSCKFQSLHGLSMHTKIQHGLDINGSTLNDRNVIECDLCHILVQRYTLSSHKKRSHFHDGQFKCSDCTCKFRVSQGLKRHRVLYHSAVGEKSQRNMSGLLKPESNISTLHQNIPVSNLSRVSTKAQQVLKNSLSRNRSIGLKLSKCDQCGLNLFRHDYLPKHKEVAHSNGKYKCTKCTCCFHTPVGLTKHKAWHETGSAVRKKPVSSFGLAGSTVELNGIDNLANEPKSDVSPSRNVNRNFFKIRGSPAKRTSSKTVSSPHNSPPKWNANETESFVPKSHVQSSVITHPGHQLKCELCDIKFTKLAYHRSHMEKAHTDGNFRCSKCPCRFRNLCGLNAHRRVHGVIVKSKKLNQDKVKQNERSQSEQKSNTNLIKSRQKTNGLISVSSRTTKPQDTESENHDVNTEHAGKIHSQSEKPEHKMVTRKRTYTNAETDRNRAGEENTSTNDIFHEPSANACTWCGKVFVSETVLNRHVLSHTRPEVCSKCTMRFRNKDEMNKHIALAHGGGQFQCYICPCRFTTAKGMKSHMTIIHKKESLSFNEIVIENEQEEFVDNEPFVQEIYQHQQQNFRDDNFYDESEPIVEGILETNYGSSIPTMRYDYDNQCTIYQRAAGAEFVEESEPVLQGVLEFGMSNTNVPAPTVAQVQAPIENQKKKFSPKSRPMPCPTCHITCYGPDSLRQHMESHVDKAPSMETDNENQGGKCGKCGVEFSLVSDLMHHLQVEHCESGLYRCAYCPCTMKTETDLRYHFMKYHST